MNAKYYPKLKKFASYAEKVLNVYPEITNKKANSPSELVVTVSNVLSDEYAIDDKDFAQEVSKQIFYGYYKEINEFYKK